MKRLLATFALLFFWPALAFAGSCPALPYNLTNGTTADATQVMANFNSIIGCFSDKLAITDNTPSSSPVTGSITTVGGLGVGGAIYGGGILNTVGAITAQSGGLFDGANQVFSVAGVGLSSSGNTVSAVLLRNWISGLLLSNDGGTPNSVLDIAAGQAVDSTNAAIITLAAFTKNTSGAWVAGSGNAGMGTGLTIAATTWYHVYAIIKGGAADVYFDTSTTAANKPAGTTAFRRIGSFFTDGSANIIAFTAEPLGGPVEHIWTTPVQDFNNSNVPTAATQEALADVPLGVAVKAILTGTCAKAANANFWIQESATTATNGIVCATITAGDAIAFGRAGVWTDTAQHVYVKASGTNLTGRIVVMGYLDPRGTGN